MFKMFPFLIVDFQVFINNQVKYSPGNFGNKKCFHSFAADLTKILNGNKRQNIARCRRTVL